ncbi:DMT family transporter [Polymorphospora rubra]|uniref:DMT family transporter n=1 Tax=Polymorphospora rubra TaxID=338584 RepID=UPI0033FBCAA0
MKPLPGWAALSLATVGGIASAAQSAANAELGIRMGNAALGAVVNNAVGTAVVLAGLLLMPSMRSGLRALWRSGLPWWAYLGGLGGAFFVTAATYAVPVLGVALFTIAQVTGNSFGGLTVDRVGLAPAGRLALTGPRVAGALLGIAAVALAQVSRPYGDLALAGVALAVAGGLAVALQSALNARLSAASSNAAGTAVNFAVSTPAVVAAAVALGVVPHLSGPWPTDWYLYLGGVLAVMIVAILLLSVRSVGVLRTGLAIVGGQLGGALLLDLIVPGGPGASLAVLAGALLTVVAVFVSGRVVRPAPAGS